MRVTTIREANAKMSGMDARVKGVGRSECPRHYDQFLARYWIAGWDEQDEALRRRAMTTEKPKPWKPSPADVRDEQGHVWFDFDGTPCCKRCAVVKRRDGKNKPCKGTTGGIGLRVPPST